MKLHITFSEIGDKTFNARFQQKRQPFDVCFGKVHHLTEYVGGDPYDGEYDITPKVEAQTMPTKEKIMLEDVTIRAIPYAEVTNQSNGKTVTIG